MTVVAFSYLLTKAAGTQRYATLKPEIPPLAFPPPKTAAEMNQQKAMIAHAPNTSKRRAAADQSRAAADDAGDEFGDAGINDIDLARIDDGGFMDIDAFDDGATGSGKGKATKRKGSTTTAADKDWEPRQLENGKWACNHTCKDKTACKHLCCREGLDKKPKPPKPKTKEEKKQTELSSDPKQTQLNMSVTKKAAPPTSITASMAKASATQKKPADTREMRELNRLHESTKSKTPAVPSLNKHSLSSDAGYSYNKGAQPRLSFLEAARNADEDPPSSDYGGIDSNGLPDPDQMIDPRGASRMSPAAGVYGFGNDDEEMLDETIGGTGESQPSHPRAPGNGDGHVDLSSYTSDFRFDAGDAWHLNDPDEPAFEEATVQTRMGETSFRLNGAGEDDDTNIAQPSGSKRTLEGDDTVSSQFFAPPKKQRKASRTPSAQLQQELVERATPAIPANELLEELAEAAEAPPGSDDKPASPDSLEKWFKEEFGTKDFNYIG